VTIAPQDEPRDTAKLDPVSPVAYPVEGKAGLMGDLPVRISAVKGSAVKGSAAESSAAERGALVAHGFGGQRIAIPAGELTSIRVRLIPGNDGTHADSSLLVVGKHGRVLLLAPGHWGPGLRDVCDALRVPLQTFTGSTGTSSAGFRAGLVPVQGRYPVLRIRPHGGPAGRIAAFILGYAVAGLMAAGGVALALLLPAAIGGVRDLFGVALAIAGFLGGL
jgi:hypothetical protein